MAKKGNWMDSFRAKNGGDVYVLQVSIVEKGKEVKNIREVVDCPGGEVGVWYAHNLLCRLANEAAKRTKMENIPWRESHRLSGGASNYYMYRKVKDPENYAKAEMEWQRRDRR